MDLHGGFSTIWKIYLKPPIPFGVFMPKSKMDEIDNNHDGIIDDENNGV